MDRLNWVASFGLVISNKTATASPVATIMILAVMVLLGAGCAAGEDGPSPTMEVHRGPAFTPTAFAASAPDLGQTEGAHKLQATLLERVSEAMAFAQPDNTVLFWVTVRLETDERSPSKVRDVVLARLTPGHLEITRSWEALSGFSAWADVDALRALAADPDVAQIDAVPRVRFPRPAQVDALPPMGSVDGLTGAGITVALIDGAFDVQHDSLQTQGTQSSGDSIVATWDVAHHDSDVAADCPGTARGTSAAATLAQVAPGAAMVLVKAETHASCGRVTQEVDLVAALDWVVAHAEEHQIHVVDVSMGTGAYSDALTCRDANLNLAAIGALADERGLVVLASAGSVANAQGIAAPACLDSVLSVGPVYGDSYGRRTHYADDGSTLCTDPWARRDRIPCIANSADSLDFLAPATDGLASTAVASAAGSLAVLFERTGVLTPTAIRDLIGVSGTPIYDARSARVTPRINVPDALRTLDHDGCVARQLYAATPTGRVLTVDVGQAQSAPVMASGAPIQLDKEGVTGVAADPNQPGVVYTITGLGDGTLYKTRTHEGVTSRLGQFGQVAGIGTLLFAPEAAAEHGWESGALYGISLGPVGACGPRCIVRFDLETANVSPIRSLDEVDTRAAAFDPIAGDLLVFDAAEHAVRAVPPAGDTVERARISHSVPEWARGIESIGGMAFDCLGHLYAIDNTHRALLRIDLHAQDAYWVAVDALNPTPTVGGLSGGAAPFAADVLQAQ